MKLEDIEIYPCLLSEANMIQAVELNDKCTLLIPVKTAVDGVWFKRKLQYFYGIQNETYDIPRP